MVWRARRNVKYLDLTLFFPAWIERLSGGDRRIERNSAGVTNRLSKLLDEIVVFFVCADPKPDDEITVFLRNSAIVIPDSY